MTEVEVLVRENCPKCKEALGVVRDVIQDRGNENCDLSLDVVDIDEVPAYRELYTDVVPVVMVDGKVEFELFLDRNEFEEVLDQA